MRVFTETQRFNQIWLWVILLGVDALMLHKLYPALIQIGETNSEMDSGTIISLIMAPTVLILINIFIFIIRLDTKYDSDGITYRFWPVMFSYKTIKLEDIESYKVKNINPIFTFGGWGYRRRIGKLLLNTRGKYGIEIKRKEGITITLGTQKPESIKEVMNYLMESKSISVNG